MKRVVSLIPSATEIVAALGCGDRLVGRSHECDFPPEVARLPVCTGARIDTGADSAAIDTEVRALLQSALAVYDIDLHRLRALEPDLIVTQSQCDVCAVSLADVESALADWQRADRPALVSLAPGCLDDVWRDIGRVAAALGVPDRGAQLVGKLQEDLRRLAAATSPGKDRPRVACIEWTEPLMLAGNWVPELVRLAGGEPVGVVEGGHSPYFDSATLFEAAPDLLIFMPCGFGLDRTEREALRLLGQPGWQTLDAVRQGRVYVTDGNQFFNRPGPRLWESAQILAEIIRGDSMRQRGTGWRPLIIESGAVAAA